MEKIAKRTESEKKKWPDTMRVMDKPSFWDNPREGYNIPKDIDHLVPHEYPDFLL